MNNEETKEWYRLAENDYSSDMESFPPIIAKNFIESDGSLNSYSFLMNWGMSVNEEFSYSLGLELKVYDGKHDLETRIHWTETARERTGSGVLPDSLYKSKNEIDGLGVRFGITSQVNQRVRLGFAFSPKTVLNSKYRASIVHNDVAVNIPEDWVFPDEYMLPSNLRFGVLFKPRNPFRTNFHTDLEFVNYSEINRFYDRW